MSQRPGIRYLPVPSTVRAPSGGESRAVSPTERMRSPSTTTVIAGRRCPAAVSTTVTLVIASGEEGDTASRIARIADDMLEECLAAGSVRKNSRLRVS